MAFQRLRFYQGLLVVFVLVGFAAAIDDDDWWYYNYFWNRGGRRSWAPQMSLFTYTPQSGSGSTNGGTNGGTSSGTSTTGTSNRNGFRSMYNPWMWGFDDWFGGYNMFDNDYMFWGFD